MERSAASILWDTPPRSLTSKEVGMSTDEVRSNDATGSVSASVDMKLEVVVIPVSDVDRAKEFALRIDKSIRNTS
jgi:hypothetical protein